MNVEDKFEILVNGFSKESRRKSARKHYETYKDTPEEGIRTLYKIVKVCPSGRGGDDTGVDHHRSLWSAFFCITGYLEYTDKHEDWKEVIQHLRDQYVDGQSHYSDDKFDFELNKFLTENFEDGVYKIPDDLDRKVNNKVQQNKKALRRFPRVTIEKTIEKFNEISKGIDDPHKLKTELFLQRVFNPDVITYKARTNSKPEQGFLATGESNEGMAYIYNMERYDEIREKLDDDFDYNPPPLTTPSAWDTKRNKAIKAHSYDVIKMHRFMCRAVFKTHGDKGGRRLKDMIVQPVFITFECDDKSLMVQESFNYVMCEFAKYAPPLYITDTGGKSHHFGFLTVGIDEKIVTAFKDKAIKFCTDAGVANNIVSWVRLPNTPPSVEGRRSQVMLYFSENNAKPQNIEGKWDLLGLEDSFQKFSKLEIYHKDGMFYKKGLGDLEDQWIKLSRIPMMNHLHMSGERKTMNGEIEDLSPCERYMVGIENERTVDFVHDMVAGYASGLHKDDKDKTHLIQSNIKKPNLLKQKCVGCFPTIDEHLKKLFNEDEYHIFLGKLSSDIKALYNEGKDVADFAYQSPYLVIVGRGGNGKTLLRTALMEKLFGNTCSAESYITGSNWTGEESTAPMLYLDDAKGLKESPTAKKELGVTIKNINNDSMRVERKFADAVTLKIFNVLYHFMNHEELGCLPDHNDMTVFRKMCILEANPYSKDDPELQMSETEGKRRAKMFKREIDFFYTYLINEHEIPLEYRGDRFPVRHFVSEGVLDKIEENSPTTFLTSIIEGNPIIYANTTYQDDIDDIPAWHGSANQLYAELQQNMDEGSKKLFNKYFYDIKFFNREIKNICKKKQSLSYSNGIKESNIEPLSPKKISGGIYYYRLTNIIIKQETEGVQL